MRSKKNKEFKPTPKYEVLCFLSDEIEPLIMKLRPEAQAIILPEYRVFKLNIKEQKHTKGVYIEQH